MRAEVPDEASGIILFGTIMPSRTLVPVVNGVGSPRTFRVGPDVAEGFSARGERLFSKYFADALYNYYVFVELDDASVKRLYRIRLKIGSHTIERVASKHGAPAARAQLVGPDRVRITWNAAAFPRLSCQGAEGSSPAPLMLDGDFTAANTLGSALSCDFSDGVKTVYSGVRIPIVQASPGKEP